MKEITNAAAKAMILAAIKRPSMTPHQRRWAESVATCNAWKVANAGKKAPQRAKLWAKRAQTNTMAQTGQPRRSFAGVLVPAARKALGGSPSIWGTAELRGYAVAR